MDRIQVWSEYELLTTFFKTEGISNVTFKSNNSENHTIKKLNNLNFVVVCEFGYYGKNCSNECSTNCDMVSSCDKVTGECDRGCKTGLRGIHCNQRKYVGLDFF